MFHVLFHGSNLSYAKLPQKPSFPNVRPSCLVRPDPPALPPPDCHSRSVCAPPSTTCHQPICLYAPLYNMSSTKLSACLPLQHVINQSICMPPSTKCHLSMSACLLLYHAFDRSVCLPLSTTCQQLTFYVRPCKTCHQLKCPHASLYNMSSTKVSSYLPLLVSSTKLYVRLCLQHDVN